MNESELKLSKCPFCGDEPELIRKGNEHTKSIEITIKCPTCRIERTNAAIYYGFDWLERVSIESWNKRVDATRVDLVAGIKRLKTAAIDYLDCRDFEKTEVEAELRAVLSDINKLLEAEPDTKLKGG